MSKPVVERHRHHRRLQTGDTDFFWNSTCMCECCIAHVKALTSVLYALYQGCQTHFITWAHTAPVHFEWPRPVKG